MYIKQGKITHYSASCYCSYTVRCVRKALNHSSPATVQEQWLKRTHGAYIQL